MSRVVIPFKPRNWQRRVIKMLKRFNVLVVHRGAGKSILAMNVLLKSALTGPHNAEYAYILPQLNQARRNVWDPLKRFVEPLLEHGATVNNSSMEVRLPNGAKIILLGAEDPETLRGLHLHGVVLDEFADMHPETWRAVRPMTTNHKAWVIWIGTPKGENKFYEFFNRSQEDARQHNWFGEVLKWQDTNALDEAEVEEVRGDLTPEAFAQEMECSWSAALVGSYYSSVLEQAQKEDRITDKNPYRPDLPVHTAWDLGTRDAMTVWWYQIIGDKINVLHYHEESNLGFPEWKLILENVQKDYQSRFQRFQYGLHWAPHDIRNRELSTGVSRIDQAARMGIPFQITPGHAVMDGISLVRQNMHRVTFYKPGCVDGLKALRHYCSKSNHAGIDMGPKHDWASHGADAFRYLMINAGRGIGVSIKTF